MPVIILKILIPFGVIFSLVPFLVWLERKGSAYIQDRPGPNRAAIIGVRIGGLLHPLADVIKLAFKEDFIPDKAHKVFYILAPVITLIIACMTFLVIPFADNIPLKNHIFTFQAADLNIGILYILAISSLGIYGLLLAGWSSNNKFSLLGALRSGSQMISYELALGLAIVPIIMWSETFSLNQIITDQSPLIWNWYFIKEPIACLIFIIACFAETNRNPFDLPEGESELVAGYHVEYSSLKFAMFFMAEYVHIVIASALIITLFFGGWQIPFFSTTSLNQHPNMLLSTMLIIPMLLCVIVGFKLILGFKNNKNNDLRDYEPFMVGIPLLVLSVVLLLALVILGKKPILPQTAVWVVAMAQIGVFLAKTLMACWFFIWVRWTLPRVRYDQLMSLGWKVLLPLGMANAFITSLRMIL